MKKSTNGTRIINGRAYMLAGRCYVWGDDREELDGQIAALRQRYSSVLTRTRRGYDVTIWVL